MRSAWDNVGTAVGTSELAESRLREEEGGCCGVGHPFELTKVRPLGRDPLVLVPSVARLPDSVLGGEVSFSGQEPLQSSIRFSGFPYIIPLLQGDMQSLQPPVIHGHP